MSHLMGGEVPYCCGGVYFPPDHFPISQTFINASSGIKFLR